MSTPLSGHHLGAIFITHVHGDHCYGLPGMLSHAAISGRTQPLTIVGPAPIELMVRTTLSASDAALPFEVEFIDVALRRQLSFDDFTVDVFACSHRVPSYAYRFTERITRNRLDTQALQAAGLPRGPDWGALQRGETVRLAQGRELRPEDYLLPERSPLSAVIAGDNDTPALLDEACRSAQVLIHEATYTDDLLNDRRARYQHSSAGQVARFAHSVNLPNLVLTHFSARFGSHAARSPSIHDVAAEARNAYAGNLFLAQDLDEFELSSTGALTRSTTATRATKRPKS